MRRTQDMQHAYSLNRLPCTISSCGWRVLALYVAPRLEEANGPPPVHEKHKGV